MIDGESLDVVLHRIHRSRRDDARLTQCSAEQLADAASFADVLAIADEDRTHRTAQALRETDRDRVEVLSDLGCCTAQRDASIEQPRAVQMRLQSVVVSPTANARELIERPRSATSDVRRVLQTKQPRDAEMLIVRLHFPFEVRDVEHSQPPGNLPAHDTAENRRAARFKASDVTGLFDQQFVAGEAVCLHSHLIRLRPRAREDGGFVSQLLGHQFFETVHRRILTRHVVADFRASDRLTHRRRGLRHRVAVKIDERIGHRESLLIG